MRIGVVVNPVAGVGGWVGLKGTDGKVAGARARGAEPRSPERARRALSRLFETASEAELFTWGDEVGAVVVRDAGFDLETLGEPSGDETSAADAVAAVEAFVDADVDLVLFVGGDGTATDVAEAPDGISVPILGVPTGVRVYSSVLAAPPEDVARVVTSFERTEAREVMDIDEDDYRGGEVGPEPRAAAHVPVVEDLQLSKQTGGGIVEPLAAGVADDIRLTEGVTYVLGPGSTVGAVKAELGIGGLPLGVDVYRDGEVLARDAAEIEILANLGAGNVIVVMPIGGQGFVFGRGNPQLSPAVIRRCDVSIVASRSKFDGILVFRVDTDDPDLDADLRGWTRVRVGRVERRMMKTE